MEAILLPSQAVHPPRRDCYTGVGIQSQFVRRGWYRKVRSLRKKQRFKRRRRLARSTEIPQLPQETFGTPSEAHVSPDPSPKLQNGGLGRVRLEVRSFLSKPTFSGLGQMPTKANRNSRLCHVKSHWCHFRRSTDLKAHSSPVKGSIVKSRQPTEPANHKPTYLVSQEQATTQYTSS